MTRRLTLPSKLFNFKLETKGFNINEVKTSISPENKQIIAEYKKSECDVVKTSQIKVIARFRQENEIEKVIIY